MKRIICGGLGSLWILCAACGGRSSGGLGFSTNPGTDSSVMIERAMDSASREGYVFPDTIEITMDVRGRIAWALDSARIAAGELQHAVQDSLLSIYLLSGRLPSRLDIRYQGTVTMGIRGAADDQVRQAQEVVRNVIATRQLNVPYGRLDTMGQQRFRDSFPVLFQSYY